MPAPTQSLAIARAVGTCYCVRHGIDQGLAKLATAMWLDGLGLDPYLAWDGASPEVIALAHEIFCKLDCNCTPPAE